MIRALEDINKKTTLPRRTTGRLVGVAHHSYIPPTNAIYHNVGGNDIPDLDLEIIILASVIAV